MKKLRVYVVEKDVLKAETLANRLNDDKGIFGDFNIEFAPGKFDYSHPFSSIALSRARPDMLIIDYSTANLSSPTSENIIAEQIKRQHPFLPILLTHRGDVREKYRISTTELSNREVDGVKVFDGFIDPNSRTVDIQKTVKSNLRKPITPAIIGLGTLGRQFLRIFAREYGIKKIKAYSEHVPADVVLGSIDHLGSRKDKVVFSDSLEDAIENTDCVLLCTSSVYTTSLAEKLAEKDNRFDLLPKEGAKLFSYFKRIAQAGYPGLITPFTNPVAGMLSLAKKAGIKHSQLTSPISIDNARFDDAVRGEIGSDYALFIDALISGKIVGDHGVPEFAQLSEHSAEFGIDYENARERLNEVITRALIRTRQMPREALESSAQLSEKGYEAAFESARFYKMLTHLDEKPNESAYTFYRPNGISGFLGLPVKISYFPDIRVFPNDDYIKEFDKKTKKTLKEQLVLQNLYVEELLSSGAFE